MKQLSIWIDDDVKKKIDKMFRYGDLSYFVRKCLDKAIKDDDFLNTIFND